MKRKTTLRAPHPAPHPAPTPLSFLSVASKGLKVYVSGLESTLAGLSIRVDSKGLTLHQNCATVLPLR